MENSKFVLGSKYDLRTKLILLIGANILIFLGFDWIYQSLITLFFLVIIISDGYKKSAIKYILFFVISVVLEKSLAYFNMNFLSNLILFILAIGRKFLPCIIVGKWILNSTSVSSAVATLQKLKLSKDSLIEIGDELSQSAIIRGLDAPVNKTSRYLIKFRRKDICVLLSMILIILIVVFMKISGWDL